MIQDKDFLLKDRPAYQDSPVADLSGQEMDSESHLSESSDRMSDFESSSLKNEEVVLAKEPLTSLSTSSAVMMAANTPSSAMEEGAITDRKSVV